MSISISENEKLITFRTLCPYIDTTIIKSAIKYTNIIHKKFNRNLNLGFYLSSRRFTR